MAALLEHKAPVIRISAQTVPALAFAGLADGAQHYELWTRLAFHGIRQRFRRSVLGPIWLTPSDGHFRRGFGPRILDSVSLGCSRVQMEHGALKSVA